MHLIIKQAKIIDSKSPFNQQIVDLEIIDNKISKIATSISKPKNSTEIAFQNLHLSSGWFDSSVSLGEPGFEDCETIVHGLEVAAKSGFTAIALQPNTQPVIDNQAQIKFVKEKASKSATQLFPIGALTQGSEGKVMAEMFDMQKAGAIAFGDYRKSISNPNLLKIALQYAHDFNALLIPFSENEMIKGNGVVNEGKVSTRLGLKGIPNLAEELQIAQNLFLLEYTGGKIHIPTISTAKSVQLIEAAKAKGLNVTCSVAVHHLVLTDEKLENFDTNYKVSPPLRTETDRKALIKGVLNGTIDMITSDHNPIVIEYKKIEFDNAKSGTIGLESAFRALLSVLPLEIIIDKLTLSKKIFNIPENHILEGETANFTLFTPNEKTLFTLENIFSKSKNSAFLGLELPGKVYGVINQNQIILS